MATNRPGNQNQGQNPGQNPGRQNGGMQQQAREAAQAAQEGLSQAGQRIQQGYQSASQNVQHGYRQAEGMIARNPSSSVLIGFGVGFGLGLALCSLMGREETWAERHIPDSIRVGLPRKAKYAAQQARSAYRNAPDAHELIDQVTDSLRHLPDALARVLPSSLTGR